MPVPSVWRADFFVDAGIAAVESDVVLVARPDGRFLFGETDDSNGGGENDVWTRNFQANADSGSWRSHAVNAAIQEQQIGAAALPSGFEAFAWSEGTAGSRDIYAEVRSTTGNSGSVITPRFLVNAGATSGDQHRPEVAALGLDRFLVSWIDDQTDRLRYAVFDIAGKAVAGPVNVSNTAVTQDWRHDVTELANGNVVISYRTDAADPSFAIVNRNGAIVKSETAFAGFGGAVATAALEGGGFVAVWNDGVFGKGRIYDDAGNPVGVNFELFTDTGADYLQVTGLKDGRFMAVAASGGDVIARVFFADGTPDGAQFTVNVLATNTGNNIVAPDIATLVDGRVVVGWTTNENGNLDTKAKIYDPRETGLRDGATGLNDDWVGTDMTDTVYLSSGDDTFEGAGALDYVFGEGGNDRLFGEDGSDRLYGGNGSDSLYGGNDADYIAGGLGNDRIDGGFGDDLYLGGNEGNDTVYGGAGNDRIDGGAGDDPRLDGDTDNDYITGAAGNDTLWGEGGTDTLYGGADNDFIDGGTEADRIGGGSGRDTVVGGAGNDYITGDAGLDRLYGGDDNDTLYGGADFDTIYGGDGNDRIDDSSAGGNWLNGDDGADYITASADGDTIYGGDGDDTWLSGGGGADIILGDGGNDRIDGGTGGDFIFGGGDVDYITAGAGNDTINGGDGNDSWLSGQGDNDTIYGDAGTDRLDGGDGDDLLFGGPDNDTITGGAGADRFGFADATGGTDTIGDWAAGDLIHIDSGGFGGGLAAGALPADRLVANAAPAPTLPQGQFLYSTTFGYLYWDADGTGAGAAVHIATVLTGGFSTPASLSVSDFIVV